MTASSFELSDQPCDSLVVHRAPVLSMSVTHSDDEIRDNGCQDELRCWLVTRLLLHTDHRHSFPVKGCSNDCRCCLMALQFRSTTRQHMSMFAGSRRRELGIHEDKMKFIAMLQGIIVRGRAAESHSDAKNPAWVTTVRMRC